MQKKRMKKSREKNPKLKIIIIVALVGIIMVVMLPFIINYIYVQNVKSDFWNVDYNIGDILLYYGGLFTFAGTSILGIMTYFQNEKLQNKSEEEIDYKWSYKKEVWCLLKSNITKISKILICFRNLKLNCLHIQGIMVI